MKTATKEVIKFLAQIPLVLGTAGFVSWAIEMIIQGVRFTYFLT